MEKAETVRLGIFFFQMASGDPGHVPIAYPTGDGREKIGWLRTDSDNDREGVRQLSVDMIRGVGVND